MSVCRIRTPATAVAHSRRPVRLGVLLVSCHTRSSQLAHHTYAYHISTHMHNHSQDNKLTQHSSDSSPGGGSSSSASFFAWPFLGPLLFENQTSDARDHCANERTFLSYLRLSVYMAVVAVAIVLSFHLKSQPSPAELRMAKPLGLVFWGLSVACLLVGLGNYIRELSSLPPCLVLTSGFVSYTFWYYETVCSRGWR